MLGKYTEMHLYVLLLYTFILICIELLLRDSLAYFTHHKTAHLRLKKQQQHTLKDTKLVFKLSSAGSGRTTLM